MAELSGTSRNDTLGGGDGHDRIIGGGGDDVIFGHRDAGPGPDAGAIVVERVAFGLQRPLFALSAPGDVERLFIVEQHTGAVRILDLATKQIAATPFLDLDDASLAPGGEQGLLGLAFHPDFASNGQVFVNLTNAAGHTEIRRYSTFAGNADQVDPSTETLVLTYQQPFANHNGGWVAFGPDGYFYVLSGDGGSRFDPFNNAQNIESFLGKLLRLDVDGDDFPDDPARNYAIPSDNPFVGRDGLDEIWAYGLRNPWRASFDAATGDLYIGDVGQRLYEEINWQPAGSAGGENYGWKVLEGHTPTPDPVEGNPAPDDPSLVAPVHVYAHVPAPDGGEAVIGGYVYRGDALGLQGHYLFADLATAQLWSFRIEDGQLVDFANRTAQLRVDQGDFDLVSSFGVDGRGRLYVVGLDGEVHRLAPGAGAGDGGDELLGGGGNDSIYGGPGDDLLQGGAGDDLLDGGIGADTLNGGSGGDRLSGGAGDDAYVVDDGGDVVTEIAAAGKDAVTAVVTYRLPNHVEDLRLAGSDAIDGSGNGGTNRLTGNSAANRLDGGPGNDWLHGGPGGDDYLNGGRGADEMRGAAGNDTYVVDDAGDRVIEGAAAGTDIVRASISYALPSDVERLGLTGSSDIDGTGNSGANVITGNRGANRLDGGEGNDVLAGGFGQDTLTGGAGRDVFTFNEAPEADTILDFASRLDRLRLDHSVYDAFGAARALTEGDIQRDLRDSITATSGDGGADGRPDFLKYATDTGELFYDPDGTGAAAPGLIATLYASATTPAALWLGAGSDMFIV